MRGVPAGRNVIGYISAAAKSKLSALHRSPTESLSRIARIRRLAVTAPDEPTIEVRLVAHLRAPRVIKGPVRRPELGYVLNNQQPTRRQDLW